MIKVSKHQKRNVLANTRRLVKDVTLVSEMVKLENISKEEANIKLEKTARSIMRKDGLQTTFRSKETRVSSQNEAGSI